MAVLISCRNPGLRLPILDRTQLLFKLGVTQFRGSGPVVYPCRVLLLGIASVKIASLLQAGVSPASLPTSPILPMLRLL